MLALSLVVVLWAAGNFVITVLMAPLWAVFVTGAILLVILNLFVYMLFPDYFGVDH